jgi:8-oxo-dGTP diphosphatase
MKLLKETGKLQENVSHRPAKLFQFDKKQYEILEKKGFNFDV